VKLTGSAWSAVLRQIAAGASCVYGGGVDVEREQVLAGGVANDGLVVRIADTVRRPWRPSTEASHALLSHLATALPGVAPIPLGRDELGREVLSWMDGDVAIPPFPAWAATEEFLVSLAQLLRRVHDALATWRPPPSVTWSDELADPAGGPLIVHADICPENVVARDGRAVAIIDWETAAPGRRIWDVVSTARFCVPFTAQPRRDAVYQGQDVTRRLRLFLDAYGLSAADRAAFTAVLDERRVVGERFVQARVARGEPAFVDKWDTPEGEARLRQERDWIAAVPVDVASYSHDAPDSHRA
jgi:Phosphotransferase enzyme family